MKALKEKTMKKYFYLSLLAIAVAAFSNQTMHAQTMVKDSISMGLSYANEVYYSLANDEISTVPRNQWDIAFRTKKTSSSILINEGVGVMLYTYPKADTSGWATVDTSGLFSWTPMYNSPVDWENGAFSRNAKNHPDYGWAIYNSVTHDLVADSLFIIKLRNGTYRKLWIERKYSTLDRFAFRFANLDGSAEAHVTVDCTPYNTKNFVGYSIQTSAIVDFEPAANSWDLLFTKYESIQPDGTPYSVTGVITNDGLKVIKYRNVSPDFTDWNLALADSSRSSIGWDWKAYISGSYIVEDSLLYFVKDQAGNMNKLMFTKFEGGTTGKIGFEKTLISPSGIQDNFSKNEISVYPNPVRDQLNISLKNIISYPVSIKLFALTGQVVYERIITENSGNAISFPVNDMPNGMYLLTAKSAAGTSAKKVVVNK